MKLVLAAVGCILMISCATNTSTEAFRTRSFVALDSIVAAQQQVLVGKQLTKSVNIDGEVEVAEMLLDSAFLANEWSFLQEFDLNKPGFVGGIEVQQTDQLVRYTPRANQNYLIEYLEYRYRDGGELTSVSGALKDQKAKALYESTRSFTLSFNEGTISNYSIAGFQKIVMNDTVFFEITGEIQ